MSTVATAPSASLSGGQVGSPAGLNDPGQLATAYENLLSGAADIVSGLGTKTLVLGAGEITTASEVDVGTDETAAEAAQNLSILGSIAAYCKANGITIEVDADLTDPATWTSGSAAGQNELVDQWAPIAAEVGLPITAIQDISEVGMSQSPAMFATYATIEANAVKTLIENYATSSYHMTASNLAVGDMEGEPSGSMSALSAWWSAYDTAAQAAGVAAFSYVTADTDWFGPWVNALSIPEWQGFLEQLSTLAAASNMQVDALLQGSGNATSAAEFIQQAEQNAADLAMLAATGSVDVGNLVIESWQSQPVGVGMISSPASPANEDAEITAVYPLYEDGAITATGAVAVSSPGQIVAGTATATPVSGLSVQWDSADIEAGTSLAVVLIDQTGTLTATQTGSGTVSNPAANILVLTGNAGNLAAELRSVTLYEPDAGADTIDVETYNATGPISNDTIAVLAAGPGQDVNSIGTTGNQQGWLSSSAFLNSGSVVTSGSVMTSETIDWSTSGTLVGPTGATAGEAAYIDTISIHEPLAEYGVEDAPAAILGTTSNAIADVYDTSAGDSSVFPANGYANNPGVNNIPLNTGRAPLANGWIGGVFDPENELTALVVQSTTNSFSPTTGQLESSADTIAPNTPMIATNSGSIADAFATAFATGGLQLTEYNTGNNPGWLAGWGSQFTSATLTYDGAGQLTELFLQGGANDPWFTIDDVFDPNTGQLWEEFQSASPPGIAAGTTNYAGNTDPGAANYNTGNPYQSGYDTGPLYVTEFNTGNNPNWDYVDWGTSVASDTEIWVDYFIIESFSGFADDFPNAYTGAVNAYPYEFVNGSTLDLMYMPGSITIDLNDLSSVQIQSQTMASGLSGLTSVDAAGATGTVTLTGLTTGGSTLIGGDAVTTINGYGSDLIIAGAGLTTIDTGSGDTLIKAAGAAPLTNTASIAQTTIILNGSYDSVDLLPGDTLVANGTGNTINGAVHAMVFLNGGDSTVYGSSMAFTLGLATQVAANGSGNSIGLSGGDILQLTGSGNSIDANGSSNTIIDSGTNTVDFPGTSGTIDLSGSSELTLGGTDGIGFITGPDATMTILASPDAQTVEGFSLASGDRIDLRQFLTGMVTTSTINGIGSYIAVTDNGSSTSITAGMDTVILAGAGLSLQDLIAGNAFAVPAH